MNNTKFISLLRNAAIGGNVLFILWVSFNAMDEGFSGTLIEKLSYFALVALLITNIVLLLINQKANQFSKQ
ncbi:MAG: hypothetical protein ACHQIM_20375 [Sphingobacteriales bacterium]